MFSSRRRRAFSPSVNGLEFRSLNGIGCLIPSTARWGASRSARAWGYPSFRRLPIASVLKSASTSQIKRSKRA